MHPLAPEGCSNNIASAHSIQRRGQGLASIARDGKVYGCKLHPMFFLKRNLRAVPDLIGIADASTFPGFCTRHDSDLFRPLETSNGPLTAERLLLLNFRVVVKRLNSVESMLNRGNPWRNMDRGCSRQEQRVQHVAAEIIRRDSEEALHNLLALTKQYDAAVMAMDADLVNGLVVDLVGEKPVVASDLITTRVDFVGRPLAASPVCLHAVTIENGVTVAISWHGEDREAEALARSFAEVSEGAAALLTYAIDYTDNRFFAPEWWEKLPSTTRDNIVDRVTERLQPERRRRAGLVPDMALPTVADVRRVGSW